MYKKKSFTSKPFVGDWGHNAARPVRDATEECFRVATTGLFDYQREAVKGMSTMEREAWIKKNSKLEEKIFNDGKKEYTLKVNADGWTLTSNMMAELARTRKMLDKLAK